MRKGLFVFLNMTVLILVSSSFVFAATGAATTYQVRVTQFEMSSDGGNTWITVSDGSSTAMDIASVDVGGAVGDLFSSLSVPDGSYTHVRVTTSDTFVIKGNIGVAYTDGTLTSGACDTLNAADAAAAAAAAVNCTVDIPSQPAPGADALPTTLVVKNGVPSHKIRVNFDVSAAITDEGGLPANTVVPGNPNVTMNMIAL